MHTHTHVAVSTFLIFLFGYPHTFDARMRACTFYFNTGCHHDLVQCEKCKINAAMIFFYQYLSQFNITRVAHAFRDTIFLRIADFDIFSLSEHHNSLVVQVYIFRKEKRDNDQS